MDTKKSQMGNEEIERNPPAPERAKQKSGKAGHGPESNTRRDASEHPDHRQNECWRGCRGFSAASFFHTWSHSKDRTEVTAWSGAKNSSLSRNYRERVEGIR